MKLSYFSAAVFLSIIYLISITNGQTACGELLTEQDCATLQSTCIWEAVSGLCKCKSEVKQDIFFAIDISGSIGWTDFQKEKVFLNELASQGVGAQTKMGFDMFSTNTNISRDLQFWDNAALVQYVNGIRWLGGFTYTDKVIQDTLNQFSANGSPDRSRIMLIVTDGVPCHTNVCPYDICYLAPQLAAANIRVIVVGVGDGWTAENPRNSGLTGSKRVECITAPGDIFEVGWNEFDTLLSVLSNIVCPITKQFTITEIKPMDDPVTEGKSNRFVEIYNSGVDFQTTDITFDGIIKGTPTTNLPVTSGQYVVFYDAVTSYGGVEDVTCQQCVPETAGGNCDLSACTAGSQSTTACHCGNAVYVPCGIAGNVASYGCYFDTTNNAAAKTGWTIKVFNGPNANVNTGTVVDQVVYGSGNVVTDPWIVVENGYPYELISRSANNDLGSSWTQACDPRGTPGTDPALDCPEVCTQSSCTANGATGSTCTGNTATCNCANGFYPNGRSCLPVPGASGNCTVIWLKDPDTNEQVAIYQWTAAQTAYPVQYQLSYYDVTASNTYVTKVTYQTYYQTNTHSLTKNTTYPAYITQSIVINGVTYTNTYSKVQCELIRTSAPSPNPTQVPSNPPVLTPTHNPTPSPTYACPLIWMADICTADRCEGCKVIPSDPNRLSSVDCCFEQTGRDPKCDEYKGDESQPLQLNSKGGEKQVAVKVYQEFPFVTCANWTITVESITPGKSWTDAHPANNGGQSTPAPTPEWTLADVGINIYPMMGTVCVNGTRPKSAQNLVPNDIGYINFNVEALNCTCEPTTTQAANASNNNGGTTTTEKPCTVDSCFDQWSARIKLRLNRHNDTSDPNGDDECYTSNPKAPTCCNIVYPLELDYTVTRNEQQVIAPTDESELPPWLWWLIAALVIFLILLAILAYKFWHNAKVAGSALGKTQDDLDAAIAENEVGFGADLDKNNVNFNPMATGQPANASNPGNVGNPNLNQAPMGNERANVTVEKFQHRQEFGAQLQHNK